MILTQSLLKKSQEMPTSKGGVSCCDFLTSLFYFCFFQSNLTKFNHKDGILSSSCNLLTDSSQVH